MARSIALVALPLVFSASCKVDGGTSTSNVVDSADVIPYSAMLSTLSSTLEQLEGGRVYANFTNSACLLTYNCNAGFRTLTASYTGCGLITDTKLTGESVLTFFSQADCVTHEEGNSFAGATQIQKSYSETFTRVDVLGPTAITQASAQLISIGADKSGTLTLPGTRRKTGTSYDFTVGSSQSSVTFSGARAAGTRRVESGIVQVTDSIKSVVHSMSLSNLSWESPTCCYPTAGTISTVVTLGLHPGNQALKFSDTQCGAFTFTNTQGAQATSKFRQGCE